MTIKVKRTSGVKYLKGFTNEISFAPDRKQYLTDKALVELYNKIEAYLHTLQASQDKSKLLLADVRKSVCKWEKKCDFVDKDGCCEIPDECKYKQTVC